MRSGLPWLPRRDSRWWYPAVITLAITQYVALFGVGIVLGLADIAVADAVPFGVVRSVVFVVANVTSIAAVLLAPRAVSAARSRRPRRHRRDLSRNSQAHNLSSRALNWRFRRG